MTLDIFHSQTEVVLSFSATLENIDRAADETKRFLAGLDAKGHAFGVVLAVREALANAVVDGSRLDASKTVAYAVRLEGKSIVMEIEDEGDGFDWRSHLGKKPAPDSESGRGVAIMEKYCEEVSYNDRGNKVVLKKRIG